METIINEVELENSLLSYEITEQEVEPLEIYEIFGVLPMFLVEQSA